MRHPIQLQKKSRGFTLIEVMIATAIFVVIFIAALMIYERSSKTFKSGMEAADVQQNTRVSFDKVVSDVRMAGFDYDRDGFPTAAAGTVWKASIAFGLDVVVIPTVSNGYGYQVTTGGVMGTTEPSPWPTTLGTPVTNGTVQMVTVSGGSQAQQPDEPIEYAGPNAITIRANLDFEEDVANDHGREPSYENIHFPVVTTGNDEIVTYALRSADASKNTGSVQFYADVNASGVPSRTSYPGGNAERLITIPSIDTTNNNPPYTLYRFTLADDGSVVASPLAENIRSMNFLYYQDLQGVQPLTDLAATPVPRPDGATVLGLGQYDPANASALVTGRAIRAKIRSVKVQLTGMNDQPDLSYQDGDAVAAARTYRKFTLDSLVVPRNLGKRGIRELDATPPGAPVLSSVCFGHCSIAHVSWQAPSSGGGVEQYAVLWDIDNTGGFANITQVGPGLSADILLPDPTQTYYFSVEAINSYGAAQATAVYSGSPKNATKPSPPTALTATGGTNVNNLNWMAPATNVSGSDILTCQPSGTMAAPNIPAKEALYYRVFRDTASASFDPASPPVTMKTLWDETRSGAGEPTVNVATGSVDFTDSSAANCVAYYYRVQALDACGATAAKNSGTPNGFSDYAPVTSSSAFSFTNTPSSPTTPSAPSGLTVLGTSSCTAGSCTVALQWPKVTTDTVPNPLTVDSYVVRRQQKKSGVAVGAPVDTTYSGESNTAGSSVSRTQSGLPQLDVDSVAFQYEFTVAAKNCSQQGAWSTPATYPCVWSAGTLVYNVGPASDILQGDGSSGNPYLFYSAPTVTITGYTGAATGVSATLYKGGSVVAGYPQSATPSAGSATFTLPDIDDDGSTYRLDLVSTQTGGCTTSASIYFTGSSVPSCLQVGTITALASQPTVTIKVSNICSSAITLGSSNSVRVDFDNAGGSIFNNGTKLDSITFPKTVGTVVLATSQSRTSPTTYSPPGTASLSIPAGTNTYTLIFTFSKSLSISTNPVSKLCLTSSTSVVGPVIGTCP